MHSFSIIIHLQNLFLKYPLMYVLCVYQLGGILWHSGHVLCLKNTDRVEFGKVIYSSLLPCE